MDVIGHDHPCAQFVPFAIEKFQRAGDNAGTRSAAQMTFSAISSMLRKRMRASARVINAQALVI
jgi:hypothetical protein